MVSSHSRFIMARMLPSRMTGDLLAGMWELIRSLGAVPRRLIWDNETGIGRRNSYATGVAAFAGVLATRIVQVRPYDPESKGVVERANQFLETSFLPGRTLHLAGGFQRPARSVAAASQCPSRPADRGPAC
jgi:transposase